MTNAKLAEGLTKVLADTFVLYLKTHSFHWNVTGPQFKSLHELFMEQYTELWNATDEIAERIRILGSWAPVSWAEMVRHASLKETGQLPDAAGMLQALVEDNKAIVKTIHPVLKAAQEAEDEATADILIQRIQIHEKATWMLISSQ